MRLRRYSAFVAGALAVVLLAVPMTQATETTRPEYKEKVEPICKVNVRANERILKGVKAEVKSGKLKPAATQFIKAANSLHTAIGKLKAIPQPPADEAKLAKWLKYIQEEEGYFRKIANKLKAGDKNGAFAMQIRLRHIASVANNTVLDFEFKYCKVEPSKFT